MADMMASQTGETLSLLKFRLNGIPRRIVHYEARRARRAAIVSDLRGPGQRRQSPASNSKVWPSRCQMTALPMLPAAQKRRLDHMPDWFRPRGRPRAAGIGKHA
jgi:hypothetical protein